jgi:hypothetical protein
VHEGGDGLALTLDDRNGAFGTGGRQRQHLPPSASTKARAPRCQEPTSSDGSPSAGQLRAKGARSALAELDDEIGHGGSLDSGPRGAPTGARRRPRPVSTPTRAGRPFPPRGRTRRLGRRRPHRSLRPGSPRPRRQEAGSHSTTPSAVAQLPRNQVKPAAASKVRVGLLGSRDRANRPQAIRLQPVRRSGIHRSGSSTRTPPAPRRRRGPHPRPRAGWRIVPLIRPLPPSPPGPTTSLSTRPVCSIDAGAPSPPRSSAQVSRASWPSVGVACGRRSSLEGHERGAVRSDADLAASWRLTISLWPDRSRPSATLRS